MEGGTVEVPLQAVVLVDKEGAKPEGNKKVSQLVSLFEGGGGGTPISATNPIGAAEETPAPKPAPISAAEATAAAAAV